MELRDKIAAVRWWQNQPGHPLTCGVDSQNHKPLEAEADENGQVRLYCLNCGYKQNFVPECVYEAYQARYGK